MKSRICDVCKKPIKTWESVTYKERYCEPYWNHGHAEFFNMSRRVKIDMCPKCHNDFMDYLMACATEREAKEVAHE